jgi:F-type H+-transporting ATPase subunit gamma
MATLRELKGRIGSVASSEKITGAMKMISSAKMHKAELALKRLLPFRDRIRAIIANLLSSDANFSSPLTEVRDDKHISFVILGSDEGLCGAYNTTLFKALQARIKEIRRDKGQNFPIDIYPVGKKVVKAVEKVADANTHIIADETINSKSEGQSVKSFAEKLQQSYIDGLTDRIELIYMNFKSAGRQVLINETYLPLSPANLTGTAKATVRPYLFEPDADTIFNTALPMYLLAAMQEVFVQNRASEQAARVMAMQSSNDNAKKLLEQLQLEYNKLRQQNITNELLDIVGGQTRD